MVVLRANLLLMSHLYNERNAVVTCSMVVTVLVPWRGNIVGADAEYVNMDSLRQDD